MAWSYVAWQVEYDATGWLLKNRDPINENALNIFAGSKNLLVKTIWSGIVGKQTKLGAQEELIHISYV